jgi:hypothetical protein
MTSSQLFRVGGVGLLIGASSFVLYILSRSAITAGVDPIAFSQTRLWVLINALGVGGACLVLLGLPAMYARIAGSTGLPAFLGVLLLAVGWMFLGLFLSLYGLLLAPWLAEKAPVIVASAAPIPTSMLIAFGVGLATELLGALLLAAPFLRGRVQPRWVGYLLPVAALFTVIGDLIAPTGPAADLTVNLSSNLGPVLLMVALGYLGFRTWRNPLAA